MGGRRDMRPTNLGSDQRRSDPNPLEEQKGGWVEKIDKRRANMPNGMHVLEPSNGTDTLHNCVL